MAQKRQLLAAVLVMISFLTSGCWDRTEIENRGYVLWVAIDLAAPEAKGGYDLDRAFQQTGTRRYRLSYELPKFGKSDGGEKSGSSSKSIVYSAEGESLTAILKAMTTKIALQIFLEDVKVILISEDVARQGIRDMADPMFRHPGGNRQAIIIVTKGQAEDFLKRKPKSMGEINSLAYDKLEQTAQGTATIAAASDLGYIAKSLQGKQGFSAPFIYLEKDEVKFIGAALFNSKGKMAGIGDEYENIGGKLWRKKLTQGTIVVSHPNRTEGIIAFEISKGKTTIQPEFSGETVRFIVEGEISGSIDENANLDERLSKDKKIVTAIAQAVEAELTNHAYAALHKLQTVRADTVGLGDLIRRKNPPYWKKIKDRWEEEILPTVEADIRIKVTITGSGMNL